MPTVVLNYSTIYYRASWLCCRDRRNVFDFTCPICGATGEYGIPQDDYSLFNCPANCGAQFRVSRARGLFAHPTLDYCFGGKA